MRRITGNLDDGRVVFGARPAAAQTKARDPVCGMLVDPERRAPGDARRAQLLFLLARMQTKFESDPEKFLASSGP